MDRRLILAIALSLLVMLTWSRFVAKTQLIDNKEVITKTTPVVSLPAPPTTPLPAQKQIPTSAFWKFSQAKFELTFNEAQAAIKEVQFKDYQSARWSLQQGLLWGEPDWEFSKERSSDTEAVFIYRGPDKKITKHFYFYPSNYNIDLEIEIQNLSATELKINLPLCLGRLNFTGDSNEVRFQGITVETAEKTWQLNGHKDSILKEAKFLSLHNRYFCAIVEPKGKNNYTAWVKKISPQETAVGLQSAEITLAPGQKTEDKFRIYLGPQELELIKQINPAWTAAIHYGAFNLISHFLLQLLRTIYSLVHNWGLAIIILSLLIYLLLYPLTLKQMRSMKEMQALQPKIEELRKIYKDNPQRLNKEILELYRQHKVNPLGGCLPMVLQIPVFFALYQALIRSVALKGANFLWIKDLSEPDRLWALPFSLPILGNEVNILPIIMASTMFIQQKLSLSAKSSGSSADQQKIMLILFPLMFGFIFYRMPAGLVLYWLMNSSLMLWYQLKISRQK